MAQQQTPIDEHAPRNGNGFVRSVTTLIHQPSTGKLRANFHYLRRRLTFKFCTLHLNEYKQKCWSWKHKCKSLLAWSLSLKFFCKHSSSHRQRVRSATWSDEWPMAGVRSQEQNKKIRPKWFWILVLFHIVQQWISLHRFAISSL